MRDYILDPDEMDHLFCGESRNETDFYSTSNYGMVARMNDVGIMYWYYLSKSLLFTSMAKSTLGFIYALAGPEIHKITHREGKTEWMKVISNPKEGGSIRESGVTIEDPNEPGKLYVGCQLRGSYGNPSIIILKDDGTDISI